jgi:hypothetical protein
MKTPTNLGGNNLVTWLQTATEIRMADLYTITLKNGSVLRYTTWDSNLNVQGSIFLTGPPHIKRSSIEEKLGLDVSSLDLEIVAGLSDTVNGVPVLQLIASGVFDGAALTIDRLFMDSAGNQIGTVVRFSGTIGAVDEVGQTGAKLTVDALVSLLSQQLPNIILQPNCTNTLFDARCTLRKKNLLKFSEQFDNAAWAGTAIVTPDTDTAPDATVSADTLQDDSSVAFLSRQQGVTVAADSHKWTASVYVKKTSGATNTFAMNLSLSGGTLVSSLPRLNTNTGNVSNGSVEDAGDYWRLSASITNNGTNTSLQVAVYPASGTNSGSGPGSDSVSATGTAVVWGVQLEAGPNLTDYERTTSAGASFFEQNTTQAGSTVNKLISASAKADGYYDNGQIIFTSGANNGLTKAVKSYSGQQFFFNSPLPFVPNAGDTFIAYPGCDKTQATCTAKFNNLANFGGFPYVPAPETAI